MHGRRPLLPALSLPALGVVALLAAPACRTAAPAPVTQPITNAPTADASPPGTGPITRAALLQPPAGEARHLANIRQLTLDGRDNLHATSSADGRRLFTQSLRAGRTQPQVFVQLGEYGASYRVSPEAGFAVNPVAAPAGDAVLFSSAHADAQGIPLPAGLTAGADLLDLYEAFWDGSEPRSLCPAPGYDGDAAYRADGGAVVFVGDRSGRRAVHTWTRFTGAVAAVPTPPGTPSGPRFTADGTAVIVSLAQAEVSEVWRVPLAGGDPVQLTAFGVVTDAVAILPGTPLRILVAANLLPNTVAPGTNTDLFLLDVDARTLERVTTAEGHDTLPSFSPDGKTLYWTSTRQGGVAHVFAAEWVP